jgi:hypothetical protein
MPWFGWALLFLVGAPVAYEIYVMSTWPPPAAVNQGILAGAQQQNPSLDSARFSAWLAQAPSWYAATTSKPTVSQYVQWVSVNMPSWTGIGNPVTTSPLYNAAAANAG